ncbi:MULTISPECIES: tetratricopeptide repeat protein [unclassified Marinovum]
MICAVRVLAVAVAAASLTPPAATAQELVMPTLENLHSFADSGHPEAQTRLGKALAQGDGMLPDYAAAVKLFRLAAEQGHPEAQNQLGRHLSAGLGTAQNIEEALVWLERAAGHGDASYQLDFAATLETANRSPEDLVRAFETYRAAADQGLVAAVTSLALMHMEGLGTDQNFAAAKHLFDQAAEAGDARALNNLGLLYVRGDGVTQDYEQAAQYFQAAADLGQRTAMGNLAVMYENGFGVAQSDELHAKWLAAAQAGASASDVPGALSTDPFLPPLQLTEDLLAQTEIRARGGDPVAQYYLALAYLGLEEATHANQARARFWFEQAAQRGHAPSMANMGQYYARGLTVPQDYLRAYAWTSAAIAAGEKQHAEMLNWLLAKMPEQQIAAAQAYGATIWTPAPVFKASSR